MNEIRVLLTVTEPIFGVSLLKSGRMGELEAVA